MAERPDISCYGLGASGNYDCPKRAGYILHIILKRGDAFWIPLCRTHTRQHVGAHCYRAIMPVGGTPHLGIGMGEESDCAPPSEYTLVRASAPGRRAAQEGDGG
jgi:hypothetical protein